MSTPSTDVVLPSDAAPPSIAQQITQMEHQFALAAPRGAEAQQIVRDALTALSQNPKLKECTPRSVLGGLMTMAQLGLRVGVLGHGWLVPFWNSRAEWADENGRMRRGAFEAQLIVGYQGLVDLGHRSGRIKSISARTVFSNDHFHVEYGVDERLEHRPAAGDRGEPIGYYAVVRFLPDGHSFFHMTHAEMEVYRDRYAMAKTKEGKVVGPWKDQFEGMAHKTCVRQLSKFMPKSTQLAVALAVDDTVRLDVSPAADPVHVSRHIEPAAEAPATAHLSDGELDLEAQPAQASEGDEG